MIIQKKEDDGIMKKLTKILAGLLSMTMLLTATACSGTETAETSSHYKSEDDVAVSQAEVENQVDLGGESIYWLATYDLNPQNNQDRSVALTLFEDQFNGKVEWITCTSDTKFDTLTNRILGGDPVDMFPYEWDALPNGVYKDQYQPLDDYIDLDLGWKLEEAGYRSVYTPHAQFTFHLSPRLGSAEAESMCRAARAAGIRVFGISDHYVRHPEPGMMPILHSPGVSTPGQFGPMMRVAPPSSLACAQNSAASCTGMPSVMQTTSSMPASM